MLKYLSVLHRRIASKHNRPLSPASTNSHFQQRGTDVLSLDLYANPWRTGGLKCDIGIQGRDRKADTEPWYTKWQLA